MTVVNATLETIAIASNLHVQADILLSKPNYGATFAI